MYRFLLILCVFCAQANLSYAQTDDNATSAPTPPPPTTPPTVRGFRVDIMPFTGLNYHFNNKSIGVSFCVEPKILLFKRLSVGLLCNFQAHFNSYKGNATFALPSAYEQLRVYENDITFLNLYQGTVDFQYLNIGSFARFYAGFGLGVGHSISPNGRASFTSEAQNLVFTYAAKRAFTFALSPRIGIDMGKHWRFNVVANIFIPKPKTLEGYITQQSNKNSLKISKNVFNNLGFQVFYFIGGAPKN